MAYFKRYHSKRENKFKYLVQWEGPDGVRRTKRNFDTKREAKDYVATQQVAAMRGEYVDPSAGKITVEELGEQWLRTKADLKPATQRNYKIVFNLYVNPYWGKWQVRNIRPSHIKEFMASLTGKPSSKAVVLTALSQILELAVEDSLIAKNPAKGIKKPKITHKKHVYLTLEQVSWLAEETNKYPELVWLLATVGLRWGEAAGLKVKDFNLETGRLSIVRNAVLINSDVVIGTPKSGKPREVAVPKIVLEKLEPLLRNRDPESYVWSRNNGQPLRPPDASAGWFSGAVKRVQAKHPGFPYITPHGLRHVAAGLMISQGVNVKVVQRQLGHASASMTLDVYADLFDGDLDSAAEAMNVAISNNVKLTSTTDN